MDLYFLHGLTKYLSEITRLVPTYNTTQIAMIVGLISTFKRQRYLT